MIPVIERKRKVLCLFKDNFRDEEKNHYNSAFIINYFVHIEFHDSIICISENFLYIVNITILDQSKINLLYF